MKSEELVAEGSTATKVWASHFPMGFLKIASPLLDGFKGEPKGSKPFRRSPILRNLLVYLGSPNFPKSEHQIPGPG